MKKGICYSGAPSQALAKLHGGWFYNWTISPSLFRVPGLDYCPMIQKGQYTLLRLQAIARNHPGSWWLVFNEPDISVGRTSPLEAARIYHDVRSAIVDTDKTARFAVGGLSNTSSYAIGWLREMRAAYNKAYKVWPDWDAVAVHHYTPALYSAVAWRQQLDMWRKWMVAYKIPGELWLTEWGCMASEIVAKRLMRDQLPWLEGRPWLHRYAWFATRAVGLQGEPVAGSLLTPTGELTSLGSLYARLPE